MSAVPVALTRTATADVSVPLPAYQSTGAAGMDVRANLAPENRDDGLLLAPGARLAVPTGFCIALPEGYEMQVRARSGLALKEGVIVANGPGTIDADYRGEVAILLLNTSARPFTISHGERVAQLVLAPVIRAAWDEVADLPPSRRGTGGFGSTGR
ncbi:dUTP diphosphatase [Oceanibium sediminis]|uniref:dUTP diphosphatase n=1 Tax=Oceanibium sediminis TaxID=2026339 RepID=UPI000DD3C3BD|nr:dUTP diphosphatase [Oceanibium sediminis]